jgi:hypothetical protein
LVFHFLISNFRLLMTGKCYYLTTLGDWKRHAAQFANSHWLALSPQPEQGAANPPAIPSSPDEALKCGAASEQPADLTQILVLIEADEGVHLALEDDQTFEALPLPLAQKPISSAAQTALAPHGVDPGATTFEAAEAVARAHPLLRHRVF